MNGLSIARMYWLKMTSGKLVFMFMYELQSKRFARAPLTSKFLVQPSSAECGGLETGYKDSHQMFQHSDRMFEQIFQMSFKISFGA